MSVSIRNKKTFLSMIDSRDDFWQVRLSLPTRLPCEHGLSTEQVPVSAYVGSSKDLNDLNAHPPRLCLGRLSGVIDSVGGGGSEGTVRDW